MSSFNNYPTYLPPYPYPYLNQYNYSNQYNYPYYYQHPYHPNQYYPCHPNQYYPNQYSEVHDHQNTTNEKIEEKSWTDIISKIILFILNLTDENILNVLNTLSSKFTNINEHPENPEIKVTNNINNVLNSLNNSLSTAQENYDKFKLSQETIDKMSKTYNGIHPLWNKIKNSFNDCELTISGCIKNITDILQKEGEQIKDSKDSNDSKDGETDDSNGKEEIDDTIKLINNVKQKKI